MVVALHQYGSIVLGQSVSALPFGMAPFFETLSNRNPVYVVRKRTRNMGRSGSGHFPAADRKSGLSGGVYTELYRVVHRALSAIRNNGVAAFQGEVYTGRIGPIVGTLESVRIIEVSAFRGCPQGEVPL